ncbi:MAG: NADH:flavin oxidoreductase [Rubripirellula sp.]|nr:NADH:flavin oxidoreductase [Rhodopirellula sp.]MCH1439288.1 NADH:flavin oxidoreductase [Rubripirellula sp.]OUX07420.1 MAG: NADH:flavin oxidoreductase [Planctomycetaceae bacterium TMED240]
MVYPRVASFKKHDAFVSHLANLGIEFPCDEQIVVSSNPLGDSLYLDGLTIGNRFCILPMEGWDGTLDGKPTELTKRRWRNFGLSGAKLVWGGEAVAVRPDGRANPNQLMISRENLKDIESLRLELSEAHRANFGVDDDLLVGLQLTHSGRYARPNQKSVSEPRTVQCNPALDARLGIDGGVAVFSDDELQELVNDFVDAAVLAQQAGFQFVDIKHCHGYLGHELLSGVDRPGRFGGSFENRTRFLCDIVEGIQSRARGLMIGVRISIFDFLPFQPGADQIGVADPLGDQRLAFGSDVSGCEVDLSEPSRFMELLGSLGIKLVCTTAGSPYYNPHIQRPAYFPPSDGYQLPEDPLVGVARQLRATAELKQRHPELIFVGSGYSYLQDWLPHTAQALVRENWVDSVGLGRMVLSYPDLPADVLSGAPLTRKKVCRTFSDCTTAPRKGIVSGCYPLDPYYKVREEYDRLKQAKKVT